MQPTAGLGNIKTTFGPNRANAKVFLYVMPIFILVGLILIFSIPAAGVLMLVIAAGLAGGYFLQMRARVEVHENGLKATDWLGRKTALLWEEVTEVYEFAHRTRQSSTWQYQVRTKDGRQVKLDMAYEKVHPLGVLVLTETGRRLLPPALAALRRGEAVPFGPGMALKNSGILSGGRELPWGEVEKIEINTFGNVIVRKQGLPVPWKMAMHAQVANFPTFRACLHEAVRGSPAELRLEDPAYERALEARQNPG